MGRLANLEKLSLRDDKITGRGKECTTTTLTGCQMAIYLAPLHAGKGLHWILADNVGHQKVNNIRPPVWT